MPKYADDIWKRAIYGLVQSMVEFHLPDLYPHVDWSRECISRDKELPNLFDPKKEGQRFVDTVVQIFLSAENALLLRRLSGLLLGYETRRIRQGSARHERKGSSSPAVTTERPNQEARRHVLVHSGQLDDANISDSSSHTPRNRLLQP